MDLSNNLNKYQRYRPKIKPGDLISFANHPSVISRLIKWRTGSMHTHSAMVVDMIEPTGTRLIIMESLGGGPVPRYLSKRVEDYKGEVWHYPLSNISDEERRKAVEFTWDQALKGIKYDYGSLFKQLIGKVSTDADRLFCSEMVQMAWQYGGFLEKTGKAMNPGEIVKVNFLGPGLRLN